MLFALMLLTMLFPQTETAPVPARLGDLSWMAGHWRGTAGNAEVEQWISDIKGDTIVGMFRSVAGGKIGNLEFYTVRQTPNGIEEQVRFFTAALAPDDPRESVMKLVRSSAAEAVFENPSAQGMVRRNTLTHTSAGTFHAHIELRSADGKPFSIDADWQRVP